MQAVPQTASQRRKRPLQRTPRHAPLGREKSLQPTPDRRHLHPLRGQPPGTEGQPVSNPQGPGNIQKPQALPSQEGEPPLPEVRDPAPAGFIPPDLPSPTGNPTTLTQVIAVSPVTTRTGRLTNHITVQPTTLLGRTVRSVPLPAGTPLPSPGDQILVAMGPGLRPKIPITGTHAPESAPRCTSCGTRASLHPHRLTSHCPNDACPERRAKQLIHMTGPSGLNINGFGPKISRTLSARGFVRRPEDLFSLDWVPLMLIPGVSAATAHALVAAADACRNRPTHLVLSALGMPSAGPTTVARLLASTQDLTSLHRTDPAELTALPYIGVSRAAAIAAWWRNPQNVTTYAQLLELGVIQRNQHPPKDRKPP